ILEPLWLAASKPEASKEIINLGGTKEYSIKEAAELLAEIVGDHEIQYFESRHEVKLAFATHEKSEKIVEFEDKTGLREGLQKMWDWAKIQPKRERLHWEEYELEKGIYSFWK